MNYHNRSYPYPVLGINNNIEDSFDVNLNVSTDKGFIRINLEYNLSNKDLARLIKEHKASYCLQIYCKGTMYREVFKAYKPLPPEIEIPSTKLNEQVEADFFICACDEIPKYTNSTISDDYKGYTYLIGKGDILAYGGKGLFYANKSYDELKSISAFMNIDSGNKKTMPMYNDYEGDKITVYLSETSYELYQKIKNQEFYFDTLHSSLVLPALAEAIRFIQSEESNDYQDRKWYNLLEKLVQSNDIGDPLQIAQKILDYPLNRSFASLYDIIK